LVVAIAAAVLTSAGVANAQASVSVVYSFGGPAPNGLRPFAGLIQASDGTLYGTTYDGGYAYGTVFQLAPDGSSIAFPWIFSGTDGANPYAGVIQGANGMLYGTTYQGGNDNAGTVFQMAPDGSSFTRLWSFTAKSDGSHLRAPLIQGSDGMLYGTAEEGGATGYGTIFQVAPDGSSFTVLWNFGGGFDNGLRPLAGLIQGADGMLYGTTYQGGAGGLGTVFRIATDGSGFALLHSFTGGDDGQSPEAGLIQGGDGTLYGTTFGYGSSTVFQIAPDGTNFATLHTFTGPDGLHPDAPLILAADGMLYGTTSSGGTNNNQGTIFRLAPDGSNFTVLWLFFGSPLDGNNPNAGLLQAMDGTFYGTTSYGGANYYFGTVFQMTLTSSPTGLR
jgi:uncharacterized repeat protein (TIGR03803 family)